MAWFDRPCEKWSCSASSGRRGHSVNAQFVNFLFSIAYTLRLRFFRSFCFDHVKRRLVDVAILACGDVFPNFAAFQRSYFEGTTAFPILFLFFIYCFKLEELSNPCHNEQMDQEEGPWEDFETLTANGIDAVNFIS